MKKSNKLNLYQTPFGKCSSVKIKNGFATLASRSGICYNPLLKITYAIKNSLDPSRVAGPITQWKDMSEDKKIN